jgi:hypothetical protein
VSKQHLNNLAVLQDDWSNLAACTAMGVNKDFSSYLVLDLADDAEDFTLSEIQYLTSFKPSFVSLTLTTPLTTKLWLARMPIVGGMLWSLKWKCWKMS